jgi:signal transduction histidine kinase
MLVGRRADEDHVEAIPRSLVAWRRSMAGFRRFLLVAAIAFFATPVALLTVLADTPLQYLPLAICMAGIVWLRLETRSMERDLRKARVRALDAMDTERQRIQRDLHDSAQQRLVSVRIHLGLLAQGAATDDERRRVVRDLHDGHQIAQIPVSQDENDMRATELPGGSEEQMKAWAKEMTKTF